MKTMWSSEAARGCKPYVVSDLCINLGWYKSNSVLDLNSALQDDNNCESPVEVENLKELLQAHIHADSKYHPFF